MCLKKWFALTALLSGATALWAADGQDGFKSLFNGKDLTGWDGDPQFWSVKDGSLTGQTTPERPAKGNTFLIWKDGTLEDFELRASYRVTGESPDKWGNSGIQYRSQRYDNWGAGGYQADIETGTTYSGILYEERARGILAQRGQKVTIGADGKIQVTGSVGNSEEIQTSIKYGEWTEYVIRAEGNHIVHQINGRVTVDVTDNQTDKRAFSGILALQLHAGKPMTVQFKDVRLKRLKPAQAKRIVLVAGTPSHGPGDHEFNAGALLLKKCYAQSSGVQLAVYLNGWPQDPTAFDAADSVALFMNGGAGHPVIQPGHLKLIEDLTKQGVGIAFLHYAVEVPKNNGGPELQRWIGAFYQDGVSTNPTWEADLHITATHPICRGINPFKITDEWYYNLTFEPGMPGVTPLLKATPPDDTRGTADAKTHPGREEILAWAKERPDGGRGFGFTGGHFHKSWGNASFRKFILNALLWTAKGEVPPDGVESAVTENDLKANLDPNK